MAAFSFPRFSKPVALLLVVGMAGAAYGTYWVTGARQFEAEMQALDRPNAGLRVRGDRLEVSGFPYRFEAQWTNATVQRARPDYRVTVQTPRLTLIRQPWRPRLAVGFAEAPTVRIDLPQITPLPPRLTAAAASGEFSLKLSEAGVQRFSIVVADAKLATQSILGAPVHARALEFHGRELAALDQDAGPEIKAPASDKPLVNKPAFIEVLVRGTDIGFSGRTPAKTMAASFSVTAQPPKGARAPLEAWRDAGGVVQIHAIDLSSDRLKFLLNATAALSPENAIIAAGTLRTNAPDGFSAAVRRQSPPATPLLTQPAELSLQLSGETLTLRPKDPSARSTFMASPPEN